MLRALLWYGFLLSAFGLACWGGDLPVEPSSGEPDPPVADTSTGDIGAASGITETSQASPGSERVMFGPETFTRRKGKPSREDRTITADGFEPPYILHVLNGDEDGNDRVSAARVWLNGEEILAPNDFSEQVTSLVREVALQEGTSSLSVELAGSPGTQLTLWLEGTPVVWPGEVTSAGGSFEREDGLLLDVPVGALSEPVVLDLQIAESDEFETALDSRPYVSHEIQPAAAVTAGPEGLQFASPITLTLPVGERPSGAVPVMAVFDPEQNTFWFHETDILYDATAGAVEMKLSHFSEYQVVWSRGGRDSVPEACGALVRSVSTSYDRISSGPGGECEITTTYLRTTYPACPDLEINDAITHTGEGCGEDFELTVEVSDLAVPVCRTEEFEAIVTENGGSVVDTRVVLRVDDSTIAQSDVEDGSVTGLSIGQTAITGWAGAFSSEPAQLTVSAAPEMIIGPEDRSLGVGEQLGLTATDPTGEEYTCDVWSPEDGGAVPQPVEWSSEAPSIATIDPQTGVLEGVDAGRVGILATAGNTSVRTEFDVLYGTVIRGRVWLDDGDETYEPGVDEPLAGHPVEVGGQHRTDATTDDEGRYRIEELPPGDYSVTLGVLPEGVAWTKVTADVTLEINSDIGLDFIGSRIEPGLISHWPGEGSGEDAAGLNDGDSPMGLAPGYAPGVVGQAFQFDASGSVLEGPVHGLEEAQEITLEAWVQIDSDAPTDAIQRFVTIQPEKAVLRYAPPFGDSESSLHFYVNIGGGYQPGDPPADLREVLHEKTLPTGCFHHIVGTYDGSELRLYLNGELVASRAVFGTLVTGEGFHFSSSPEEPLVGLQDEVKAYNVALSAEEVRAAYEAFADDPSVCGRCELESFTDLGTFGGEAAVAHDVSDHNELLVGVSMGGTDEFGFPNHKTLYYPLGGNPVEASCSGRISDSGVIAGSYLTAIEVPWSNDPDLVLHACMWTPAGGLIDANPAGEDSRLNSWVTDVNDAGRLAGGALRDWDSFQEWAVFDRSGFFDPLSFNPHRINNHGYVINDGFGGTGWLRSPDGTLTALETPWGSLDPTDLNDENEVVGYAGIAVLWADGQATDLGALPTGHGYTPSARARGLNDASVVVGYSLVDGKSHAFFWTAEDGLVDIHPAGYAESMALEVNDNGVVVGAVGDLREWDQSNAAALWELSCRAP